LGYIAGSCYNVNYRMINMLKPQGRTVRPNSAANSLPTPIRRPIAVQNSAAGRLDEITTTLLMSVGFRAPVKQFSGETPHFFPAGRGIARKSRRSSTGPAINSSLAARIGQAMEPVLRPVGFNWRIDVALVPRMAAREVAVAALGGPMKLGGHWARAVIDQRLN